MTLRRMQGVYRSPGCAVWADGDSVAAPRLPQSDPVAGGWARGAGVRAGRDGACTARQPPPWKSEVCMYAAYVFLCRSLYAAYVFHGEVRVYIGPLSQTLTHGMSAWRACLISSCFALLTEAALFSSLSLCVHVSLPVFLFSLRRPSFLPCVCQSRECAAGGGAPCVRERGRRRRLGPTAPPPPTTPGSKLF